MRAHRTRGIFFIALLNVRQAYTLLSTSCTLGRDDMWAPPARGVRKSRGTRCQRGMAMARLLCRCVTSTVRQQHYATAVFPAARSTRTLGGPSRGEIEVHTRARPNHKQLGPHLVCLANQQGFVAGAPGRESDTSAARACCAS